MRAPGGMDPCRGQILAAPNSRQNGALLAAAYEEGDLAAARQRRKGESDARLGRAVGNGGNPARALLEHGAAGEERCRVTVLADAQKRRGEERAVSGEAIRAIKPLQRLLVGGCRQLDPARGCDRMNVLARRRHAIEERGAYRAVIAARIAVRNEALVAPEPMRPAPREAIAIRRRG